MKTPNVPEDGIFRKGGDAYTVIFLGLHFMTIYSREGREVSIGAVMRRAEYSHVANRTVDVWYVKLRVAGTGRLLNQGQWFSAACLRADNGWKEIQKALRTAGDISGKTAKKKTYHLPSGMADH